MLQKNKKKKIPARQWKDLRKPCHKTTIEGMLKEDAANREIMTKGVITKDPIGNTYIN